MNVESLEMAKRRDKKVYITDIAIDKVPFIQYKGFTDNQNRIMRELAQEVLTVSKDENDSNEVAITCDLGVDNPLEVYGVSFGTEHEVDVRADTLSNHILVSQKSVAVALFNECVEDLKKDSPLTEVCLAALLFLAKSSEVGIYYR